MNIAIRVILALTIVGAMAMSTGCASYMVYKESHKQVAMRKALITNNQQAIKSLQLGGDASAAGIPVSFSEALVERPWLQTGAAGVDALIGYGVYEGVRAIDASSNDSDSKHGNNANNNQSGENTTIVQGNGNTVNVGGSGGNTNPAPEEQPTQP
jgi:hypothetical protein